MISGYRFGALLIVCALLGSCSSPGHFEPTPIVGSEAAMIYLYRPAASNPGAKPLLLSYPEVMIDGVSHGVLKYNSYRAIELPPGIHDVRLTGLTENCAWPLEGARKAAQANRPNAIRVRPARLFELAARLTDRATLPLNLFTAFTGQRVENVAVSSVRPCT